MVFVLRVCSWTLEQILLAYLCAARDPSTNTISTVAFCSLCQNVSALTSASSSTSNPVPPLFYSPERPLHGQPLANHWPKLDGQFLKVFTTSSHFYVLWRRKFSRRFTSVRYKDECCGRAFLYLWFLLQSFLEFQYRGSKLEDGICIDC